MHPALNQQMQAARMLELNALARRPAAAITATAPRRHRRLVLRRWAVRVVPRPAL